MEFQFHPASAQRRGAQPRLGRARARDGPRRLAGALLWPRVSLWVTVPAVVAAGRSMRASPRRVSQLDAVAEAAAVGARGPRGRDRGPGAGRAVTCCQPHRVSLRGVAGALADGVSTRKRACSPGTDPERVATQGLRRYLAGLERGRVAARRRREAADPDLAGRTPSRLPLASELVEPAVFFGPRVSPWTGCRGVLRGPATWPRRPARAVVAPADGTVVFTGRSRGLHELAPVALRKSRRRSRHGSAGAHALRPPRQDRGRGAGAARAPRRPASGPWERAAGPMSPALHYEYWRRGRRPARPDRPALRDAGPPAGPAHDLSLEKMRGDLGARPPVQTPLRRDSERRSPGRAAMLPGSMTRDLRPRRRHRLRALEAGRRSPGARSRRARREPPAGRGRARARRAPGAEPAADRAQGALRVQPPMARLAPRQPSALVAQRGVERERSPAAACASGEAARRVAELRIFRECPGAPD